MFEGEVQSNSLLFQTVADLQQLVVEQETPVGDYMAFQLLAVACNVVELNFEDVWIVVLQIQSLVLD